jgi:hypothetical protein
MIKFNQPYSINDGQGTIVFKDAGNNKVEATYEIKGNKVPGNVSGKFEGSTLKAIYQVNEAKGLMDFTFSENGFEAKWKKGVEEGPMKGKWTGSINSVGNTIETTIKPKKEETVIEKPKVVDQKLLAKEQELKQLEATLLQKQKELEAKAAELEAKAAIPTPTVVTPPKVIIPTPSKVTHKIVSIKITNVTKLKPLPADKYWSGGAGSYKISDLPRVGESAYYTVKYEVHKNYKVNKSTILGLFDQGYSEVTDTFIPIKCADGVTVDEFQDLILKIHEYRPTHYNAVSTYHPNPKSDINYSFKISIVSIE